MESAGGAGCAGDCCPVCEACTSNLLLWDPLVVAELAVPSFVVRRLKKGTNQEDVVDPFTVPDPREPGKVLLAVRVHQLGDYLHLGYEQCTSRGLLVWSQCSVRYSAGNVGKTVIKTRITSITPAEFSIAEVVEGSSLLHLLHLRHHAVEIVKFTLQVLQRQLPVTLPAAMQADRQSGTLCDVTLSAEGRDFPAHRVVLAAGSDVFRAMFTGDFVEKRANRVEITGTSAKALARFLDFLYVDAGDTHQDWEECELELFELADQYQVHRLRKLIQSFMWWLPGPRALALLLRAGRSPLLAPAMLDRLCGQVALQFATLRDSADWRALLQGNPHTAGIIEGIVKSGGPVVSAMFPLV